MSKVSVPIGNHFCPQTLSCTERSRIELRLRAVLLVQLPLDSNSGYGLYRRRLIRLRETGVLCESGH